MGKGTKVREGLAYMDLSYSGSGIRRDLRKLDPMRTPDMPDLGAPPASPSLTDEAVRRAREAELARTRAGGRRSTFLTGPLGAPGSAPTQRKSLLGS
jgi:hypothetical protein